MSEGGCDLEAKYRKKDKQKALSLDELNELSNKELIERVVQLEAYNTQLKHLLKKKEQEENKSLPEEKAKRKCNFENCGKRHVLLKLYYLGWDTQGFVIQDNTINTIEYYLFQALEKCCLIENRETSNYQRCGRTDKGVSAFCQVISIDLRSKFEQPTLENCENELPYLSMLNHLLPDHIKCYSWAHVESNVGARFDCSSRTYQYYFPKGDLNISLMEEGCKYLVGEHDFRNFCKMDVANGVTQFIRKITGADIKPCSLDSNNTDYGMFKFIIRGNGFLWHQIRNIMTVLFLVGQGKESPDVIQKLLDVKENPCKPQYTMADHVPLTLFVCEYENSDVKWNVDDKELTNIIQLLQKQWTFQSVKEVMMKEMIDELSKLSQKTIDVKRQVEPLISKRQSKVHKPLLSRMKCESLENRIEHYVKRRKLVKDDSSDGTWWNHGLTSKRHRSGDEFYLRITPVQEEDVKHIFAIILSYYGRALYTFLYMISCKI